MASFHYEPLDDSPDAILIAYVLPGLLNGKFQVSLLHDHTPKTYRFLYYTWVDVANDHEISMNGILFRVRDDLFQFLNAACQRMWREPF